LGAESGNRKASRIVHDATRAQSGLRRGYGRTQKARPRWSGCKRKSRAIENGTPSRGEKPEPRVSLTDWNAADALRRRTVGPAIIADCAAPRKASLSVSVTDRRNDSGLAVPMVEEGGKPLRGSSEDASGDTHYRRRKILWRFHNVRPERSKSLCHPLPKKHT